MACENNQPSLRVVIIGGSITGLTLAHCLDKAGIDYVLLEKHQDILASLGASVALQPPGCRILDQLGVFDRLKQCRHDLDKYQLALPGDFKFDITAPGFYTAGYLLGIPLCLSNLTNTGHWSRMGYPVTAITRRNLLHALYTSLEDLSKVKTGTRVIKIDPSSSLDPHGPLKVTTEFGEQYTGDVVVGADGTHGVVRDAMWRTAETSTRGPNPGLEQDKRSMQVDYYAIVGMTGSAEEVAQALPPGPLYLRSHPHCLFMVIPYPDTTITWFAIIKTDRTYIHPDVPSWSQEDVAAKLEQLGDYTIRPQVTFRDLWQRTSSITSTACHEGLLQTWSAGRMTCIGDAAFKCIVRVLCAAAEPTLRDLHVLPPGFPVAVARNFGWLAYAPLHQPPHRAPLVLPQPTLHGDRRDAGLPAAPAARPKCCGGTGT
ncbi:FAD-dependent oxidoreductase [Aspergillus mulundensis]|uniref:FAD-binding domain-containing protein n=1 Tax=Aspergillus mulundensis TaxID=1810919 RepID=A0A3D8R9Z8_9EURO|nr:hypothetical protein DSM5745_08394 [Aspergillus mulundensis]RDW70883.1 hypothetical protein DSM5745_08394 [Aspergillus mulundensis]